LPSSPYSSTVTLGEKTMAKFVHLSGYYLGYHKQTKSSFFNVDKIEYVYPPNEDHTYIVFQPDRIFVVEKPLNEVMALLVK
jgi:hypothetical protein